VKIYFHSEDREIPEIDMIAVKEVAMRFCADMGKKAGDINFIYCSDEYLLDINKNYLNHDYYTDIVTFNYNEEDTISGDIYMSRDRIEDNSREFGEDQMKEFVRVCGHGLLHLLGFNDASEEEKAKMRKEEERFINEVRDF
jgi:rRNA maturation RNase YbeY